MASFDETNAIQTKDANEITQSTIKKLNLMLNELEVCKLKMASCFEIMNQIKSKYEI